MKLLPKILFAYAAIFDLNYFIMLAKLAILTTKCGLAEIKVQKVYLLIKFKRKILNCIFSIFDIHYACIWWEFKFCFYKFNCEMKAIKINKRTFSRHLVNYLLLALTLYWWSFCSASFLIAEIYYDSNKINSSNK